MSRKPATGFPLRASLTRRSFLQTSVLAAGTAALAGPFASGVHAQEEGLVWYSGSSARSVEAWSEMFAKETGIPTEFFRSGGVKLAQKFEAEVQADQVRCSVIDSSLPGIMMDWVDRGLIAEYESPQAKYYPADVKDPGYWAPIKALVLCIAYNSDIISPDEAPKTWEDVLDPKWKGAMTMPDAFYSGSALHWYGAMRKAYGKSFMENLSKQDVLLRQGSGATAETLTTGERPLAPMMLLYRVFAGIDKGAPLEVVIPEAGAPVSYMVIGLPKDAPNPDAGKQFIDFALSEPAQTFWQKEFHTPSLREDVEPLGRDHGRRPLSEITRINSSPEDMREFHSEQQMLLDEWNSLFK
jgi:iron(III) transport system substrate-binding protein